MVDPVRRRATYDDVLAAPAHQVAEILGDALHLSPRPATPHAVAASVLGGELGGAFGRGRGGPGGWIIVDQPELHLGADIVVPDLAAWRREELPKLPSAPYLTIAPAWVCEVLSPSTSRLDRAEKLPLYARERVRHAWLLDPIARTLEVLRLDGERWVILATHAGEARLRAAPFDAIELELGVLWADVEAL
jgi:Uma2 family endonuclease